MNDYSKKRFLVVDDLPASRDALRSIAQNIGAFSVEFANNYQDAIYRIRNNTPDIILCDYMLGESRSGQQLLEELRRFSLLPDESVFMMVTGEQSYEQVVSAVELVPDDYIIKPFSPDKLVLRLDRIFAKKQFFADYYRERRKGEYARALALLQRKRDSEAGRPYRYETLRQQAETLLAAGHAEAAESTYRQILENYDFPWARAGVARTLHEQKRLTEAREEIDQVVARVPNFFDAADLKATICLAQGEAEEAQRVLDEVSKKTPRNYVRKRLLAEAAALNGDMATANAAMADVLSNDTMPGAVQPEDRLALARSQLAGGDKVAAERTLLTLKEGEVQNLTLDGQASFAALMAVCSPEKGKSKFAGLRPALLSTALEPNVRLDIIRAALDVRDNDLADVQTDALMSGEDAKKTFNTSRTLYALYGREVDFRNLQKAVAMRRIHRDPAGAAAH